MGDIFIFSGGGGSGSGCGWLLLALVVGFMVVAAIVSRLAKTTGGFIFLVIILMGWMGILGGLGKR